MFATAAYWLKLQVSNDFSILRFTNCINNTAVSLHVSLTEDKHH